MTTVNELYQFIDRIAPFDTAMSFDNVGLLVGDKTAEVTRALIALDITETVLHEAEALGAELVISHHPIIFDPLKSLMKGTVPYNMAASGISALCCHTNLDIAEDIGVNAVFAKALGLRDIERLGDVLLTGKMKPVNVNTLASQIKSALNSEKITYTKSDKQIGKVAVCCGAGGEYITEALGHCDAFITGEAHHHELLFAAHNGLPIFVCGHYETEKLFATALKACLNAKFTDVEFVLSEREKNPVISL